MSLRTRLLLTSLATLAVGLGALLVVGNVLLAARVQAETTSLLQARAEAQVAALSVAGGRLVARESPNDGRARPPVVGLRPRSRGRAPGRGVAAARPRGRGARARPHPGRARRARRHPPARRPSAPGRIPAARSSSGCRSTRWSACSRRCCSARSCSPRWCCWPAGSRSAARSTARCGRSAQMTAEAEDWGAHDLDRRFELGPPRDELTALAATLDGLLGRIAASRRHEQRFAAEVAHELRTPVAGLRARAELALRARGAGATAEREAALRAVVDDAARLDRDDRRAAGGRPARARPVVRDRRPRRARARGRGRRGRRARRPARGRGRARDRAPRARTARRERAPPRARARVAGGLGGRRLRPPRRPRRRRRPRPGARRARLRTRRARDRSDENANGAGLGLAARAAPGALVRRRRRRRPGPRRLLRAGAARRLNGGQAPFRPAGATLPSMSTHSATARPAPGLGRQMLNKVPEVTLFFWIIKIMCTTVGETAADYLNENLGFGLTNTTYVTGALLAVLLLAQFRLRRYVPAVYWAVVVVISVFGTLITDNLSDGYNVPLTTSTPDLRRDPGDRLRRLVRRRAHAVDPHDRHDAPRVLLLARDPLHVRARHRGRRPGGREARPRLRGLDRDLRRPDRRWSRSPTTCCKLNPILSFWLAYILTRPLGASIGDEMSQHSKKYGGLNLGTTGTSLHLPRLHPRRS